MPLVGGVAGLLFGLVAGWFATMRSGVYFSMITLALPSCCTRWRRT